MRKFLQSEKLSDVCYDIRGPVMDEAQRLEQEGYYIDKLNIGNPAPNGLMAPENILHDLAYNLKDAQGYCDSKGLFSARKAILQDFKKKGVEYVDINDIYTGNGVSELIVMAMQGLLNNGDEILIPAPDYPLWTAAVRLAGGIPVHYICDESSDWNPDIEDIRKKVNSKTKGIVVINPNNPTGAVYDKVILEEIVGIAKEHELVVFADEIYEKILYEDVVHTPLASISDEILCITFNGLSKSHRIAGFRIGWMILSGKKSAAKSYIEGLDILSAMRLCSNVPAQLVVQTALGENDATLNELLLPKGRLLEQRDHSLKLLNEIDGISCVKPKGAFYLFPKLDIKKFKIKDDAQFVLDLLIKEKVLLVQGSGFNWVEPDHFRVVFLPTKEILSRAIHKVGHFLEDYSQY